MRLFFRYFFRTLRIIIGPIILMIDKLTTPKGVTRPDDEQTRINHETENLCLYQYWTCPFCVKTRRTIKRLSLIIETRDAQHDQQYRQELITGGGVAKVPCLKITDANGDESWMYESNDIIHYLQKRFA